MAKTRDEKRAATAIAIARLHYTDEYDEDSYLAALKAEGHEPGDDVDRYLLIATEYGGDGPADAAEFHSSKAAANKRGSEYVRDGWAYSLYDLDARGTKPIKVRVPR